VKRSAGIALFRRTEHGVEVLLGHMGGPYWARKDAGAWTIPKGEVEPGEDPLAVARREFEEELGTPVPAGPVTDLGEIRQAGGKTVRAWAVEGDLDVATVVSNTFELEWPPRSGRMETFPEIDRAAWFDLETARSLIITGQRPLLDHLPT
jgi:predicted NUDIX family NTP pyrophosphohydrolase